MKCRIRSGKPDRRRLAAGACALVLGLPIDEVLAQRSPPGRESAPKGNIVRFEEAPSANVLYLEEGGGMVTAVTRPMPREAGEEPAPAAAVPAKATLADTKAKADAAARRAAPRRSAAVPETAGTKP